MPGVIAVDDMGFLEWTKHHDRPWKVGAHVLSAGGVLEDIVLNNGCVVLPDPEC
jgi:hypothetical protein